MKKIGTIYAYDDFKRALKEVMQKPSRNKDNPISEIIRCEIENNIMKIIYTDTYRLSYKEMSRIYFKKNIKFDIPIKTVQELVKLKLLHDIDLWERDDGAIIFMAHNTRIYGGVQNKTYQDYNSVLRCGAGRIAGFNVEVSTIHLLEVMKEAYKIASKRDRFIGAKYAVKLEIDKDKMTIYAKAGLDEFKDTIPIINESGKTLEIGVNSKHLIDFLKLKIDKITTINFENYHSPVAIKATNGLTQIFMSLVWRGE